MSTAKEDGIFNEETGRNFLEKFWGRAEYTMFCNYSLIFGDENLSLMHYRGIQD
jgi:hypothetical protein